MTIKLVKKRTLIDEVGNFNVFIVNKYKLPALCFHLVYSVWQKGE
jgi:hypothetical protein